MTVSSRHLYFPIEPSISMYNVGSPTRGGVNAANGKMGVTFKNSKSCSNYRRRRLENEAAFGNRHFLYKIK